jgi:hypothetical protein
MLGIGKKYPRKERWRSKKVTGGLNIGKQLFSARD